MGEGQEEGGAADDDLAEGAHHPAGDGDGGRLLPGQDGGQGQEQQGLAGAPAVRQHHHEAGGGRGEGEAAHADRQRGQRRGAQHHGERPQVESADRPGAGRGGEGPAHAPVARPRLRGRAAGKARGESGEAVEQSGPYGEGEGDRARQHQPPGLGADRPGRGDRADGETGEDGHDQVEQEDGEHDRRGHSGRTAHPQLGEDAPDGARHVLAEVGGEVDPGRGPARHPRPEVGQEGSPGGHGEQDGEGVGRERRQEVRDGAGPQDERGELAGPAVQGESDARDDRDGEEDGEQAPYPSGGGNGDRRHEPSRPSSHAPASSADQSRALETVVRSLNRAREGLPPPESTTISWR